MVVGEIVHLNILVGPTICLSEGVLELFMAGDNTACR